MLTTDTLLPDRIAPPRRVGRAGAGDGPAVAIIGAGFSGTMAAIHLRRSLPPDHIVMLFDRTLRCARGPAFAVSVLDRGAAMADTIEVQRVIHATGGGAGATQDGLIAGLVCAGQVRIDEHGMGLEVTETLRVVDRDGLPQPGLWALGPIVRASSGNVPPCRTSGCRRA